MGGEQTDNQLFLRESKPILTLKEILKREITSYFDFYQGYEQLIIKNQPVDINLQGWFVRLKAGGFQEPHIHSSLVKWSSIFKDD